MSFEIPEVSKTTTTDRPESLSIMGSSLKDGLESIRTVDNKQNTSENFLPNFELSGSDTNNTNINNIGGDITQDEPAKPIDPQKDMEPPTNSDQQSDAQNRTFPTSPSDSGASDSIDTKPNEDKGSEQIDGYEGSDLDNKNASDEGAANAIENQENNEQKSEIFIDIDAELEVGKDGKVTKISYTDKNGKTHSLNADQWKNVKGSKDLPGGWSATRGSNGEITIQMPNGKLVHLDAKGRFKGYVNPNK